ncbi:DUF4352 domain-containing protein [Dermatophilus congolensis]|nr:DUF4352 domain-containing protein [Dermatophilus congolensis]
MTLISWMGGRAMGTSVVRRTGEVENGFGTSVLVLGINTFIASFIPLFGLLSFPLALIGILCAIVGIVRVFKGKASNFGSAAVGLVLSTLAAAICVIWVAMVIAVDAAMSSAGNVDVPAPVAFTNSGLRSVGIRASSRTVEDLGKSIQLEEFSGAGSAVITVDKFEPQAKSKDSYMQPDSGNKLVAVHVSIKNTGKKTYNNISWIGAKIYSNRGQPYSSEVMTDITSGPSLPSTVDLKPGGDIDGWIAFQIPSSNDADSFVFDEAEWSLVKKA